MSSSYLNFLDVCIHVFHQIWDFSPLFLQIFSLPFLSPSGNSIMLMLVCLMVSHRSLGSVCFSSIFLSLSQSKFLLSYLQVYWLFLLPAQVSPLNLSSDFFITFIVLFRSKNYFLVFFNLFFNWYFLFLFMHGFLYFLHILH